MSSWVLDASAVLALLNSEPGADRVFRAAAEGAKISTVNLSEVVAKLDEAGMPAAAIRDAIEAIEFDLVAFDATQAYRAGLLRRRTRDAGLSLGDRACLALAGGSGLPALTADRRWQGLELGVAITVLR